MNLYNATVGILQLGIAGLILNTARHAFTADRKVNR